MEEALRHLREELKKLISHINTEHQRIMQELEFLELREKDVTEQTFDRITDLLQDAWEKAMSARNRLQDLDKDFDNCDEFIREMIAKLEKALKP